MPSSPSTIRLIPCALLVLLLGFGIWLRIPDESARKRLGADEGYYGRYVETLDQTGLLGWPDLIAGYIEKQKTEKTAFLPPTRILFLASASLWHSLTGAAPIDAVRAISCLAGILTLLLAAAFFYRVGGLASSVGGTALVACSPLLIHLSHRALIDGFFALTASVALWGLWESTRLNAHRAWLALYAIGLAAMVLTKENAAFVFIALCAIIFLHRWLQIGTVSREIVITTFAAPAIAAGFLIVCAGGLSPLLEAYRLNVEKSVALPYAVATGDGLWHRYLLDFLLVSPALTTLALISLGAQTWDSQPKRYFVTFVAVSYAVMAQVRYGMNMRYGAMWIIPLAWLALHTITHLATKSPLRWRPLIVTSVITLTAALELQSYAALFRGGTVYDPVAGALTQKLGIWQK